MREVRGAGAVTGGSEVARTAGCHGGGEGGSGGCGGTGQPASATGPEVVGIVVVVGAGRAAGCDRRPLGRCDASAGRSGCAGAEMAARPEPLEALGCMEADVAVSVARAATAVPPSTIDRAAHERFIREKSTVHCRGPPDHAPDGSAPPVSGVSWTEAEGKANHSPQTGPGARGVHRTSAPSPSMSLPRRASPRDPLCVAIRAEAEVFAVRHMGHPSAPLVACGRDARSRRPPRDLPKEKSLGLPSGVHRPCARPLRGHGSGSSKNAMRSGRCFLNWQGHSPGECGF